MTIPFVDLDAQLQRVRADVERRIQAVLDHGNYIMGPEIGELETALASYVGVPHAVACSSGTDALLLALLALGVGPGHAVLTTPFTFVATAEVISLLGATPVFVDVDPDTYNIDPRAVGRALAATSAWDPSGHPLPRLPAGGSAPRPAGVIAVDLFGLPADFTALEPLCRKAGVFLVEDAAQSMGAHLDGRMAGSLGDASATSFFPAKPLGCYGDGGMVFTARDDLAEALRSLRIHGKGRDKYDNVRVGLNARMDTLQAAVLLAKLARFPEEVEQRQVAAERYHDLLRETLGERVVLPRAPGGWRTAWAQYTIRLPGSDREALQKALHQQGVPTAVYYPKPLHLQTAYRDLGYRRGDFPVAEQLSDAVLSLPFGPYLQEAQARQVVAALARAV